MHLLVEQDDANLPLSPLNADFDGSTVICKEQTEHLSDGF